MLPCLPHVDSIVVNEVEAGALVGADVVVEGPDAVVHFPAGAVAAAPDGRTYRQGARPAAP